jgi:hypothetical protein
MNKILDVLRFPLSELVGWLVMRGGMLSPYPFGKEV